MVGDPIDVRLEAQPVAIEQERSLHVRDRDAAMRQAIEDHKRALATDKIAYHADIAFHKAIAEASKNPFAILVLKMISEPLAEQRRRTNAIANAAEAGLRDHERIFRAIEELNPEKARFAMLAHMKTVERYWRIASSITPEPQAPDEATMLVSDP